MIASVLPLLAAWLVAVVAPGPDFLAVMRIAARDGRRSGLAAAAGVATGMACWASTAMLGLTVVLDRYAGLYLAVRTVGAVALAGYGVLTIRHAWRRRRELDAEPEETDVAPRSGAARAGRAFRVGLFTNLANPKALVFFGALFGTLLPHHTPPAGRMLLLALIVGIGFGWYCVVTAVASSRPAVAAYRRARRMIDTVTGGLFIGVGAALVPR